MSMFRIAMNDGWTEVMYSAMDEVYEFGIFFLCLTAFFFIFFHLLTNSVSFAAYYKAQDAPFTINNLVSSGAFCFGGTYLLTIDNPGTGNNDSPLQYPSLTFNWYKETSPTTSVFIAEGNTLEVSEEGTYFAETNYGTCTSNSYSNRVIISEVTSGESQAGISSSLGNIFCPSEGATILSTIGGSSYKWFKDGEVIENATAQMYEATESGTYAVQVDLGDVLLLLMLDLISQLVTVRGLHRHGEQKQICAYGERIFVASVVSM